MFYYFISCQKIYNYNTFRYVKEDGDIGKKVKEGWVSLSLIYQIMVRLKNEEKKDSSLFKELQEFISQKKNEEIYNKYDKRIK